MGGNALKTASTRRQNKHEYVTKTNKILEVLRSKSSSILCEPLKSFAQKVDFGDSDVIYTNSKDQKLLVDDVKEMFNPSEIVVNGPVISFDFEEMQVDLIFSKLKTFEYFRSYASFNDLGNLCGKVAHRFGLKHGHGGLTLPVRDGNHGLGDVLLTTDHDAALRFLGYDPERFEAGFDTLEDIFEYAMSTEWFDPQSYAFENVNATARIRDKKRSTYNGFLKYLETQPKEAKKSLPVDKTENLEHIFSCFPEALPVYSALMKDLAAQRYLKTRFNGEIVHDVTGLQGKELGELMQILKQDFRLQAHTLPIISDEVVRGIIREHFRKSELWNR